MKKQILRPEDIYFDLTFRNKKQAIKYVGKLMLIKGFIKKPYIKSMVKRDKVASVAIGNGLAIPHAEQESFQYIENPGMVMIKLGKPLKWDNEEVYFIVGLALNGDNQIDTLQELALSFNNLDDVKKLYETATEPKQILKFLKDHQGSDKNA